MARMTKVMKKSPRTTPRTGARYAGVPECFETGVTGRVGLVVLAGATASYGYQLTILVLSYLAVNTPASEVFENPPDGVV